MAQWALAAKHSSLLKIMTQLNDISVGIENITPSDSVKGKRSAGDYPSGRLDSI
jgi:hypothetical protein